MSQKKDTEYFKKRKKLCKEICCKLGYWPRFEHWSCFRPLYLDVLCKSQPASGRDAMLLFDHQCHMSAFLRWFDFFVASCMLGVQAAQVLGIQFFVIGGHDEDV